MPVFNKSEYLEETLNSIIHCCFTDREILIVDDASTDTSLDIAKKFAKKHKDIVAIERAKNGGLSASRNTGLEHARGKYIQFWDADDLYDPDGLGQIIELMEQHNSDIATGIATREGKIIPWYKAAKRLIPVTTFSESKVIFNVTSSCFKIYRKYFLDSHQLKFVEGLHVQDYEFNFRALNLAKRITVTPYTIGDYRKIEQSTSRAVNEEKLKAPIRIDELTQQFMENHQVDIPEGYRQRRNIQAAFLCFIQKLVDTSLTEWDPYRTKYLNLYRQILKGYTKGLRIIFKANPRQALGLSALVKEDYALAEKLLIQTHTPPPYSDAVSATLEENPFGFPPKRVATAYQDILEKLP